jgi:hypothetical protein
MHAQAREIISRGLARIDADQNHIDIWSVVASALQKKIAVGGRCLQLSLTAVLTRVYPRNLRLI